MMIKIFFKYSLLMFVLFYSNIAMSNNEIYFVDMKFIMNNSLAGKSIIKQLNKKNESSQKKFKDKEKKLKDEEKKIISQKNVLNENEYLLKAQSFKKKVDDYKLSRNKMINEAQKNLTDSLSSILAEYAKKNSVAYIIPKENIIIGRAELDVTNAILEILNSKIKNIEL